MRSWEHRSAFSHRTLFRHVYLTRKSPVWLYMQHVQHVSLACVCSSSALRSLSNVRWETARGVQVLMRQMTSCIQLNPLHMHMVALKTTSMWLLENYFYPFGDSVSCRMKRYNFPEPCAFVLSCFLSGFLHVNRVCSFPEKLFRSLKWVELEAA